MIKCRIPRHIKGDKDEVPSLRGKYVDMPQFRYNVFCIKHLEKEFNKGRSFDRFKNLVEEEMKLYFRNDVEGLREHPFWKGDEAYLLDGYIKLHRDFIERTGKSRYITSRNICAANADTCMTLLQRHKNTLYATSRSCDISLGYLADLYTLYLYARHLALDKIVGVINTPHMYVNNITGTVSQFKHKVKLKLIFNKRN